MSEIRQLSRRTILLGAGSVTVATACSRQDSKQSELSSPAILKGKRRFTCPTAWNVGSVGLWSTMERLSKSIYEITDGRLEIDVKGAGQFVPALEVHDAVSDGAAEMGHTAEAYNVSKSRAYAFFMAVPGGMVASEQAAWLEFGGGQALWDELSAGENIKPLACGQTGAQTGGWYKRPVEDLEQFKRLKIRATGFFGDLIREIGGSATLISGSEIFLSLQTGVIDAAEWISPYADIPKGFYQIAPFCYSPGIHEAGTLTSLIFNKDVWESLSAADQRLFKCLCNDATYWNYAEYTHGNAISAEELTTKYGVTFQSLPEEITNALLKAAPDVWRSVANSGGIEKRIVESYESHLSRYKNWSKFGDGEYLRIRNGF